MRTPTIRHTTWLAVLVAAWAVTTAPLLAAADDETARKYFTDVELVNQDGETLRLYSDLLQGKVVVINAIFTTCEGVCPVTMGNMVKIQNHLGERLGKDVHLLSLTVDRETDTPAKLKEYARKFKARPGWHFLTGSPENIDLALRKLGLWVQNKDAHSTVFLIGNVPTGLWKKALGMANAGELLAVVDSVLDDRLKTGEETSGR